MTDEQRDRIIEIANGLREAGLRVSSRSVYAELGRKGSYPDVSAAVTRWQRDVGYEPEIELHALPKALKLRLLDIGAQILGQVRAEEAAKADAARAEADASRRAFEAETAEAVAMTGQLLEHVRDLQAEIAHLRALTGYEGGVPSGDTAAVGGAPARTGPVDGADEFWVRVADEVRALLAERGPMWESDILDALPGEVRRRSTQVGLPLFGGWLGFHLRRMVEAGDGIEIRDGQFTTVEPPAGQDLPGRNVEATRFWRLVMLEVAAILRRANRAMTAAEAIERLEPYTLMTARHFEAIKPGMLAEKMRVRATCARALFVDLGDGLFKLAEVSAGDDRAA